MAGQQINYEKNKEHDARHNQHSEVTVAAIFFILASTSNFFAVLREMYEKENPRFLDKAISNVQLSAMAGLFFGTLFYIYNEVTCEISSKKNHKNKGSDRFFGGKGKKSFESKVIKCQDDHLKQEDEEIDQLISDYYAEPDSKGQIVCGSEKKAEKLVVKNEDAQSKCLFNKRDKYNKKAGPQPVPMTASDRKSIQLNKKMLAYQCYREKVESLKYEIYTLPPGKKELFVSHSLKENLEKSELDVLNLFLKKGVERGCENINGQRRIIFIEKENSLKFKGPEDIRFFARPANYYDLVLMSEKEHGEQVRPKTMYYKATQEGVRYKVVGLGGEIKSSVIPWEKLSADFRKKLANIEKSKYQILKTLLDHTAAVGHTSVKLKGDKEMYVVCEFKKKHKYKNNENFTPEVEENRVNIKR